jgi:hypothetical protein
MVGRFSAGRRCLRSLLFFFGAVLVIGIMGCGGEKANESASTADHSTQSNPSAAGQIPSADVTSKPGSEIATEPVTSMPLEGLFIKPYFDDAGTQAELSVAIGQAFSIGVWAETAEPYTTNAAQYRLELPPGVRVTSTNELEAKSVSMGDYADNYQVAYDCQPSGNFRLVQYMCVAEPGFAGGEVKVQPGVDAQGVPFIGFSTCDFQLAPAAMGSAILKKK